MVSSISAARPGAKDISVPIGWKPAFWRTRSDPALSLAARARSGRTEISSRSRPSARVAIPCPPGSAIYPVGDLGRSLRGVAPDRADEPRIADDRPKPVLRGGHDLRHVGVEGASIARVFGCECRHAHRLRVAHLLEDRVEIRSLHRTKRKLRHETKRRSAGRARGPRSDAGRPDRGTPRDGRSGAGRRPAPRCRPAPARPRPARPAGSRGRA